MTDLCVSAPPGRDRRPVIVLCHARSGSTLLAYLLNANPVLFCPAETNFGQALLGIARWAAEITREPEDPPGAELVREPQVAIIRDFVDALYSDRLKAERASRWCDKSLGSHVASELIERVFPDAQFICFYRNFPDFAASALEACPYGLRNYGFDQYTHETPGNAIFSLARYWLDHVRAMTTFQDAHPRSSIAITYESLVQNVDAITTELGTFLDAPWDEDSLRNEHIFRPRYSTGFQDHKITATSRIKTDSVNRQWLLPVHMIPPASVEAVNELHARLGYAAIDKPQITGRKHIHLDTLRLGELDQVEAAIAERMNRITGALADTRPVVIQVDFLDVDISLKLTPLYAEVSRAVPTNWDVRITTTIGVLRDVTKGANVASLMTSGQLKTEFARPDSPDLEVMATMHHFWRAISDSAYAADPNQSLSVNCTVG